MSYSFNPELSPRIFQVTHWTTKTSNPYRRLVAYYHVVGVIFCLNVYRSLNVLNRFKTHFNLLNEYANGLNESILINQAVGQFLPHILDNSSVQLNGTANG